MAKMLDKSLIKSSKIWVVKIGSALLTHPESGLNSDVIQHLADQIVALHAQGIQVVLVSSGSIAEGLRRLGMSKRPTEVHRLQASAAVGQMGMVHSYQLAFNRHDVVCAQVLLTHADLANRMRYLNARRTIQTLLEFGAVPIINENDTVVTDEVRRDNDTLGALVANLIEADALVVLTDQDGLFTADPRHNTDAQLIHTGVAGDPVLLEMAGDGGELGTGGMRTKLQAAQKAARSGTLTIIVNGRQQQPLERILRAEAVGTWLFPRDSKIKARKQWISGQAQSRDRVLIDQGAAEVLQNKGRSLLPIGVVSVEGRFSRGDIVQVCDQQGREVACGIVNYSAEEAHLITGQPSDKIKELLGYADDPEIIHRDNLVVY